MYKYRFQSQFPPICQLRLRMFRIGLKTTSFETSTFHHHDSIYETFPTWPYAAWQALLVFCSGAPTCATLPHSPKSGFAVNFGVWGTRYACFAQKGECISPSTSLLRSETAAESAFPWPGKWSASSDGGAWSSSYFDGSACAEGYHRVRGGLVGYGALC